ncbi:MAG: hypothetical protein M3H12_01515 [Chromatiales bacterium]
MVKGDTTTDESPPPPPPLQQPKALGVIEREVEESMTKTLKEKARLLVAKLKTDPLIRWNDRGEFVYDGILIARRRRIL